MDTPFPLAQAGWAVVGIVVAQPLISCIDTINKQMTFPEALSGLEQWMRSMEDEALATMKVMMQVNHWWDVLVIIFVVCVMAGVCEELFFRGVLQKIFGRIFKNPHAAIWVTAIIFSAIHFQFYGFVTRMIMGAYLGYLLYFTRNIWVPVLVHFINNLVVTIVELVFADQPGKVEQYNALGYGSTWWLAVASFALFVFVFFKIRRIVKQ
jgi:membrane protease YdiL (CAAX protease family)